MKNIISGSHSKSLKTEMVFHMHAWFCKSRTGEVWFKVVLH